MLIDGLTALQELPWITELRNSRWSYATVNASHIVGIALLFGAIVPLDLRLIGCWRSVSIRALARVLLPVAVAGLLLAIGAGMLLFSIRAVQYAGTTLFQIKLGLILCGVANAILLRNARHWEASTAAVHVVPPLRLRAAGALSIALWLAVIVCGRMLAFLN
jgi:hypothetical protein